MENGVIVTALKGLFVGATMLVPGVSGGSMAMLLGCYDRLIRSVSSFAKNKKSNLTFLAVFALGGVLGMMIFAKPLAYLLACYEIPVMYFFVGTVAGGVPLMWKEAGVKRVKVSTILFLLIGATAIILLNRIGNKEIWMSGDSGHVIQVLVGVVAAVALVLPGISVSYLFLIFGMYEKLLAAIAAFDIGYLLPIVIGGILGVILVAKVLESALDRYPEPVYLTILGFIVGSIIGVFPGIPQGGESVISLLTLAAGFVLMLRLSSLEIS